MPGDPAAGGLALYYAGIALATEKPELYAGLSHIQDTGEALGEKVFNLFSHGSAPEMVAFGETNAQEAIVEDGEVTASPVFRYSATF